VEKLSIPFIPETRFKAKYTRLPRGSKWESWAAMGVYVDTRFTVPKEEDRASSGEPKEEARECLAIGESTMTCPFYVFHLVKWQLDKSHTENNKKLQTFFAARHTTDATLLP
jgi:hypothetical protein